VRLWWCGGERESLVLECLLFVSDSCISLLICIIEGCPGIRWTVFLWRESMI